MDCLQINTIDKTKYTNKSSTFILVNTSFEAAPCTGDILITKKGQELSNSPIQKKKEKKREPCRSIQLIDSFHMENLDSNPSHLF